MNIHLLAILMWPEGLQGFDPFPYIFQWGLTMNNRDLLGILLDDIDYVSPELPIRTPVEKIQKHMDVWMLF